MNFFFLPKHYPIPDSEISKDVDMVLWSMKLHRIRRYFHQRFFEAETREAEYASRIEPHPRLESVSEHSWHVADTALMLAPRFSGLNVPHCLTLAIIHDKIEIITGDIAPIGRDGTGEKTHAFDKEYRKFKDHKEVDATEYYLGKLSPEARVIQEGLLTELRGLNSKEACFVKAIDKFQALAYVYTKKDGIFEDKHIKFTIQYTKKCIYLFPPLLPHYNELKKDFFIPLQKKESCHINRLFRNLQISN